MRVTAVAYFFPPVGGAGVQRNLRLVSHLDQLGLDLAVLTGTGDSTGRWAPPDAGLAAETPESIEVRRLDTPEPSSTPTRARLERLLRVDSAWTRWWRDGIAREGPSAAQGCDLIWALMQPYQSAEAVGKLAKAMGVPWVADLADPWALDEMLLYPTGMHRALALRQMRRDLASASGIVMSTREAARLLVEAFPELADRPLLIGPVGWDRRDFEGDIPARHDEAFRIVHTGDLHTELGRKQRRSAWARRWLGGARDEVDILARSHVHLLAALQRLLERRPALQGRLELHLAGVQSPADQDVSAGAVDVRWLGYVDHPDAVALMRSADLLFLPMHDLPPGHRATIVPGKTYEYLASGRPILAAVPDGDARDILAEAGSAFLCRPTDEAEMAEILSGQVDVFLAGTAAPTPRAEVVERYEYGSLASELGRFFAEILSRSR
jgi:glycosyltransferase involved in cell wall biosynthesis